MHSCDYEALAYDGAVYCTACLPEDINPESDEVSPIFADSEWDSFPVCERCQRVHDYVGLTTYGQRQRYLRAESQEIREMRRVDKLLPTFAWPGGYPLFYLTKSNDVLCPGCANAHEDEDDPLLAVDAYYEGPPLACEQCCGTIESAYGDPAELDNPER